MAPEAICRCNYGKGQTTETKEDGKPYRQNTTRPEARKVMNVSALAAPIVKHQQYAAQTRHELRKAACAGLTQGEAPSLRRGPWSVQSGRRGSCQRLGFADRVGFADCVGLADG